MADKVKIRIVEQEDGDTCLNHVNYVGKLVEVTIPTHKDSSAINTYCPECIKAYKKAFTFADEAASMDSFSAEYNFLEKEKVTK
ncbi:hypothetical protein COJ96_11020 [Bacillus sp. AFS073361]|uniref:hypothetical protein n=1 Tax=Bacillus sp. AFS073361 TaxID=2033511 RepID=UPI000BF987D3|nr:hypothetical protein [Bacillus sp. AFS073361]PFP29427.1 hypothetical protein COJ96_11020 [Bacillus sp. AFS073361]